MGAFKSKEKPAIGMFDRRERRIMPWTLEPLKLKITSKPIQEGPSLHDEVYVMTSIISPECSTRIPSDIVLIIDISGSMGNKVKTPGSEVQMYSVLDIVKHAVKTILDSLGEQDRLAIVAFGSYANTLFGLTKMDQASKVAARSLLDKQEPTGGTYLWDGLKMGLDILKNDQTFSTINNSSVMLLTDGEPSDNVDHIANLQSYFDANGGKSPGVINTFGFGYNLNTTLLRRIAVEGGGAFTFIPDCGLVGTTFVNSLANILVSTAIEATLVLEPIGDARILEDKTLGLYAQPRIRGSHPPSCIGALFSCLVRRPNYRLEDSTHQSAPGVAAPGVSSNPGVSSSNRTEKHMADKESKDVELGLGLEGTLETKPPMNSWPDLPAFDSGAFDSDSCTIFIGRVQAGQNINIVKKLAVTKGQTSTDMLLKATLTYRLVGQNLENTPTVACTEGPSSDTMDETETILMQQEIEYHRLRLAMVSRLNTILEEHASNFVTNTEGFGVTEAGAGSVTEENGFTSVTSGTFQYVNNDGRFRHSRVKVKELATEMKSVLEVMKATTFTSPTSSPGSSVDSPRDNKSVRARSASTERGNGSAISPLGTKRIPRSTSAERLSAGSLNSIGIGSRIPSARMRLADLLVDLEGQVTEAISKPEIYRKWGRHYLTSLMRAHELQQCNNFKDAGVQHYGGDKFREIRDIAEEVFCTLPPPSLSKRVQAAIATTSSRGTVKPTMAVFNDKDAGCVHENCMLHMAGDLCKRAADIRKGDVLANGDVVECVLRVICSGGSAALACYKGGLMITKWHPVSVDGEWMFPAIMAASSDYQDLVQVKEQVPCRAVYSFLVKKKGTDNGRLQCSACYNGSSNDSSNYNCHCSRNDSSNGSYNSSYSDSLMVNGVKVITLGHGIQNNPVASHAFFGTKAIIEAMKQSPGYIRDGVVEVSLRPNLNKDIDEGCNDIVSMRSSLKSEIDESCSERVAKGRFLRDGRTGLICDIAW